jgi:hypothetical protein
MVSLWNKVTTISDRSWIVLIHFAAYLISNVAQKKLLVRWTLDVTSISQKAFLSSKVRYLLLLV